MIKILKFAKKSWYIILAIILLLFIQANCELALPEYTSNIVDVGIQYRGIENSVPDVIRRTSMENLSLFLTEEQKQTVLAEYTLLDKTKIKEEEYQKYQKAYPKLSEENLYILNVLIPGCLDVHYVYEIPAAARRGHRFLWNWSYRWL